MGNQNSTTRAKLAETYNFFNRDLRRKTYRFGDAYDGEKWDAERANWAVQKPDEYLAHVKHLAYTWPHLRLLADFMEVGTTPARWDEHAGEGAYPADKKKREEEQTERTERTNVAHIRYPRLQRDSTSPSSSINGTTSRPASAANAGASHDQSTSPQPPGGPSPRGTPKAGKVDSTVYKTAGDLSAALRNLVVDDPAVGMHLFVVEDLSRHVIEELGHRFGVEPAFFREHIVDFAWYNIRDPWRDPPSLDVVARQQRWFQLRFVRARYFESGKAFKIGFNQAARFNVLRRPDDDQNNKAFWDKGDAKIGLTRSKATFWLKKPDGPNGTAVAILLLDPTVKEGHCLWGGYRNWTPTTPEGAIPPDRPPMRSFFDDYVFWAAQPEAFAHANAHAGPASKEAMHVPAQALLHLICAEWLTIADYIKTRLNQIDWEIAYPEHFLESENQIDIALKKLHVWRRLVPLYREMLAETLLRAFQFPCHPPSVCVVTASGSTSLEKQRERDAADDATSATISNPTPHPGILATSSVALPTDPSCPCPMHDPTPGSAAGPAGWTTSSTHAHTPTKGAVQSYKRDFALALSAMEEYQQRIDRLTLVVTAAINIEDARRGYSDNKNLHRLTWLATFFIPMSFIAALLSMQPNVAELADTIKVWAYAAVPSAVLTMLMVLLLSHPDVLNLAKWILKVASIFKARAKQKVAKAP